MIHTYYKLQSFICTFYSFCLDAAGYDESATTVVENVSEDQGSYQSPQMVMDASYSFSYDNDLTARVENAGKFNHIINKGI